MENNVGVDPGSSSSCSRKMIERNRRNQMKALYGKLNSLLLQQYSKEGINSSVADQVEEAANYIKKLQIKLEKMKEKKKNITNLIGSNHYMVPAAAAAPAGVSMINRKSNKNNVMGLKSPKIEIYQMGLALQVVLITTDHHQLMFTETIRVLQQQGVDIFSASYYKVAQHNSVFHSIHCQVVEESGNELAERISEKLNKLIYI